MTARIWDQEWTTRPEQLAEPWTELHWAVQYIASTGQTFVEPRDDDSHRAMTWDTDQRAFVGMPFAGPYPFRVAVRPEDLTLLIISRTGEALGTFPLAGRTQDEGYEWLSIGMATYLGGMPPLIERPEWDLPDHPVRDGEGFGGGRTDDLRTIAGLYAGAAELIGDVVADRSDASEVICWPHHFDIASLITLERDEAGQAARTTGVGMAPGEGNPGGWYLYASTWPAPDAGWVPELEMPTDWRTNGWTGVVLRGDTVTGFERTARAERVRAILRDAISVLADEQRGG